MTHAPILPILIPLLAAIVLVAGHRLGIAVARVISLAAIAALCGVAAWLVLLSGEGKTHVYRLGDWPAPYGIVLVLDRLSALMVALTSALAVPVAIHAGAGTDAKGRHFHALLQLQLMGLAGAFLTGDIFNLFVFFEILLLASYALLAQGGGSGRTRAGIAYVVLNLTGSALFLIALGLLYGTLGTLNLADIARVLPAVPADAQALVRTAAALLVAVFALKAALLPVGLWLPHVYTAASVPVAVLFALMTKVGVYALLRVWGSGFAAAPFTAELLGGWLTLLALLTIAIGTAGALAGNRLATVAANLVLVSTGTLLLALPPANAAATSALLYYLLHTVPVTGGLLLLAGWIAERRGAHGDLIEKGPRMAGAAAAGAAFLVLAIAASGLPPLSGFLGKLMLLQSLAPARSGPLAWAVLLVSGLVVALVLARAASAFFWEPGHAPEAPGPVAAAGRAALAPALALALLAAASPLLTLAARPAAAFARAAAEQLHAREAYVDAVLGAAPVPRERRP